MSETKYPFSAIEAKWQAYWQDNHVFGAEQTSDKPPFYVLEMFPYPSGTLHMGHARNYAIGDAVARFQWAKGFNVLHPMGWDACGLPAENAALKHGVHPKAWTYQNANTMKEQAKRLGFSHDWSREFFSCDPTYYVHEQRLFLQWYEQGLAYRKQAYVNWDPLEQSVLANEQVVDGRGWRSGAVVEKKLLTQWFLKITDFATDLLNDLDQLTQWPESVVQMQRHWIGASAGLRVLFPRLSDQGEGQESAPCLEIFTTRPETLFGATFCAIAWDHPWIQDVPEAWAQGVQQLVQECRQQGTSSRLMDRQDKRGVHTGLCVRHPLLPECSLPVVVANYVSSDYGTGAVFGCPGHDARDHALAVSMGLPIVHVMASPEASVSHPEASQASPLPCVEELADAVMIHSQWLDGQSPEAARDAIIHRAVQEGWGIKHTATRLRDWGIGRQRYWGVPIPIIHCPGCGAVPVPQDQLPVILPDDVSFEQPGNPLDHHPTWKHVHCPQCQQPAVRETDTFDTFMESSWYFARFCDPHNAHTICEPSLARKWLPVHQYIGGIEHAVLHLLYARFVTKALKRSGFWDLSEPFQSLFTQGMVCHKTYQLMDGTWVYPQDVDDSLCHRPTGQHVVVGRSEKMSKSKCNVVGVTEMVQAYGADAVRLFVLSDTPAAKDLEWTEEGIEGAWRYVKRLWSLFHEHHPWCVMGQNQSVHQHSRGTDQGNDPGTDRGADRGTDQAMALQRASHRALHALNDAMRTYGLNKYIALLRQWSHDIAAFGAYGANVWPASPNTCQEDCRVLHHTWTMFVQAMAPVMPHWAEEVWSLLGHTPGVHRHPWPQVNDQWLNEETCTLAVQINGKNRGTIDVPAQATEEHIMREIEQDARLSAYLHGTVVRTIIVPGRMVSLVVRSV